MFQLKSVTANDYRVVSKVGWLGFDLICPPCVYDGTIISAVLGKNQVLGGMMSA